MIGAGILATFAGGLAGLGALEYWVHMRCLNAIPIRIHVSGTRGKSSVTRLIAAAMNEAGIKTIAKTTGTLARMILPDGKEVPVYRPAEANIIEQKRIIRAACKAGAQAVVMECMALQPILHWISEGKLIRATHGVITNARADHLDIMGPTETDVAQSLAGIVPLNGTLFTAEKRNRQVFKEAADDRHTRFVAVSEKEIESISQADLAGFSYSEHPENVALVLKLLADFDIDRQSALRGMWKTKPDPGALAEYELDFFGRRIIFINGFAANDPESSATIWTRTLEKHNNVDRTVAVFNMRSDRPSRTQQMARDATFWHEADRLVLIGSGAYLFARLASRRGFDASRFILSESGRAEDIFETILGTCGESTLVIGLGNIGGPGMSIVRYFSNRCILRAAS